MKNQSPNSIPSTRQAFILGIAIAAFAFQACSSAQKETASKKTVENRSLERPKENSTSKALPARGCITGDCENGKGAFVFSSGAKYTGKFKNGLPEGNGVMYYPNGDVYTGPFKKGKRSGYGTYVFKNGDKYVGEFLDGQMKGLGNYVWADGSVLKGEFKENGSDGGGIFLKPGQTLQDKGKNCDIENRNITCRN